MAEPQQIYRLRLADGVVVYRLYDMAQLVYVTRVGWRGLSVYSPASIHSPRWLCLKTREFGILLGQVMSLPKNGVPWHSIFWTRPLPIGGEE